MASKRLIVGVGIPMIITGALIAIFWAPLVGDAVSYTHLTLPTTPYV